MLLFLLILGILIPDIFCSAVSSVPLILYNHAGAPIELWWINAFVPSRDLVLQSSKPLRNATSVTVNSYDTHEFLVKFFNRADSPQGYFVKGPEEEEVHVHYDPSIDQFQVKVTTEYDRWVEKMDVFTMKCLNDKSMKFSECLALEVQGQFTQLYDEHQKVLKYREAMSRELRNYTCSDPSLGTSSPINSFVYSFGGKEYPVDTLFDLPYAKIWTVANFITDDECEVFRQHAWGKLKSAAVVGPDGRSTLSKNRRAQDAHYEIPIDYPEGDPLWPLYSRVMNFANIYGNLTIEFPGQETFNVIQYNPSDEYLPRIRYYFSKFYFDIFLQIVMVIAMGLLIALVDVLPPQ